MVIANITTDTYQSFINDKPYAIILFDAPWDVGPGAMIRPSFEATAVKFADRINFGEINVDESQEIARQVHILNVPTVAYYKNGQLIKALIGAYQDIEGRLSALMDGGEIGYDDGYIIKQSKSASWIQKWKSR
jgi:thioredoxin 1